MLGRLSCPLWNPMNSISHAHETLDPFCQNGLSTRRFFFRGRSFFSLFQFLMMVLMAFMPMAHSIHGAAYSSSAISTQISKVPLQTSLTERWDLRIADARNKPLIIINATLLPKNDEGRGLLHLQAFGTSINYRPFVVTDVAQKRDRVSKIEKKGNFPSSYFSNFTLNEAFIAGDTIPKSISVKGRLKVISLVPETPANQLHSPTRKMYPYPKALKKYFDTWGKLAGIDGKSRNSDSWRTGELARGKRDSQLLMNTNEALEMEHVPGLSLQSTPSSPFPSSYHHYQLSYKENKKGTNTDIIQSSSPYLHSSTWTEGGGSLYDETTKGGLTETKQAEQGLISRHLLQTDNYPLDDLQTKEWSKREAKWESEITDNSNDHDYEMDERTKSSPRIRSYRSVSDEEIFIRKKSERKHNHDKKKNVKLSKKKVQRVSLTDNLGNQSSIHRNKRKVDLQDVSVMEGGLAELPCDLEVNDPNDSVQLILWIKEGIHTPLYSYDYRELQGGSPKEIKPDVNSTLAQRTSFRVETSPTVLLIEKVEAEDAGVYRCRADFNLSPTINRRVNLTVIVPPRRVMVSWRVEGSDATRDVVDQVAGPFQETQRPTLICSNEDGWPPASISWYEDDLLLDDSFNIYMEKGFVENEVTLQPLGRGDLGRRLTCMASNTNSTQPATTTVTIGMTLGILGVQMEEVGRVWAGEKTEVECTVWGSRPLPAVVWWLGPNMKTPAQTKVLEEGNITISVLSFIPTPKDDGVMLICQATNDGLPDQAVQDSRLLSVSYSPVVSIHLGTSLDPSMIKEGDDVYFECFVKAKPPVFKVVWKQNGAELSTGAGVFVANMSLVLQRVNRSHAGQYSCEATNIRDTVTSSPINLDIKYTPVCLEAEKNYFSVARGENSVVSCRVESNPVNVTFSWSFNNSAEAIQIPNDKFVVVGTESRVSYTPKDEMDYGTLQCRANNTIGMQATPCLFKIIPAGKPDPPHNCRVSDVTISSLQVNCLPGDDGGLNQTFQLQVFIIGDAQTPVVDVERDTPTFSVANLRPATPYKIVIVALNNMGHSRVSELETFTARLPESQQETNAEPTRDREREPAVPFFILVGGGVMLVPLVAVLAVLLRLKFCRSSALKRENSPQSTPSHAMDPSSTDIAPDAAGVVDECDPDILSHTPGVTCEKPQWKHVVECDISALPASIYNPPKGGFIHPTNVTAEGHPPIAPVQAQGYPAALHPSTHRTAISTSQVPYYTDASFGRPMGKVGVLSTLSFTQVRQEVVSQSVEIQEYQHPSDTKPQLDPCSPFPHIFYPTKGCVRPPITGSSQYDISQLQENWLQQSFQDSSGPPNTQSLPRGFRSCQLHSQVPAPPQVSRASVVDSKLFHSSSCQSPRRSIGGGSLRRPRPNGSSRDINVRTNAQCEADELKVESQV